MGCISSKHIRATTDSPPIESYVTVSIQDNNGSRNFDASQLRRLHSKLGALEKIKEEPDQEDDESDGHNNNNDNNNHNNNNRNVGVSSKQLKKGSSATKRGAAISFRFGRVSEAEHVAAGWPAWLTATAPEAVKGWLPLKSESFEKFEKIGQGTYSSVYRARDLNTGKMVALKKVKFDNFQPESIRFMAREIMILRRLDHPNIMKLEGIITSRLSSTFYLVFEYMEHDLSGLISCPGVKFTESQIKCYMRQLLSGLEHCHSRGIMHRDIKSSNVLVNNEGVLKIADFGLANYLNVRSKHELTSRVVTLWYRPPELLLGSTNYGQSVDLWSVGCVFAELFIGRPLLKGRTEVEQLHKIFKLCGSPPEDYWIQSKLPLASMFKPQHPYDSLLRERCKEFPKSAVNLIESFLSIEPHKRCSASDALESKYFTTKPYACDPSSLPQYPPNKEMDAKLREEARRRNAGGGMRSSGARNPRRSGNFSKGEGDSNSHWMNNSIGGSHVLKSRGATVARMSQKPSDTVSEASQLTESSQGDRDSIKSVPIDMIASSNFAWTKRRKHDTGARFHRLPSSEFSAERNLDSNGQENNDFSDRVHANVGSPDEITKRTMQKQRMQSQRLQSFLPEYEEELPMDYDGEQGRARSGPLLYQSQSNKTDTRQEYQNHKSRFSQDVQ